MYCTVQGFCASYMTNFEFRFKNQLPGIGMKALDFVELTLVIEGHGVDTAGSCVADVRRHLGRVGEDDAAGIHAQVCDFGDLRLRGTVEASA